MPKIEKPDFGKPSSEALAARARCDAAAAIMAEATALEHESDRALEDAGVKEDPEAEAKKAALVAIYAEAAAMRAAAFQVVVADSLKRLAERMAALKAEAGGK